MLVYAVLNLLRKACYGNVSKQSLFVYVNCLKNKYRQGGMIMRRHNTRFSIMVAGSKESGKTVFFNSLINKEVIKTYASPEINIYLLNLDCDGVLQKITFIDTPGFGDSMDDRALQDSIVDYIKDQFDSYIEEETKIRRNTKYEDTRVHCLLYFISSSGKGLKQRDITFLKRVSGLVNIIPVVSRAEGLTESEVTEVKSLIRDQLEFYNIRIFDFENEYFVPQPIIDQQLNSLVPFTCVFPERIDECTRTRNHICGVVEVDNPMHNDFPKLKEALLTTHIDTLIETTASELYENYRSDALENILQN